MEFTVCLGISRQSCGAHRISGIIVDCEHVLSFTHFIAMCQG